MPRPAPRVAPATSATCPSSGRDDDVMRRIINESAPRLAERFRVQARLEAGIDREVP
jgi:hypothetical protein